MRYNEHRARKVVEAWESLSPHEKARLHHEFPVLANRIIGLSAHIEVLDRAGVELTKEEGFEVSMRYINRLRGMQPSQATLDDLDQQEARLRAELLGGS